MKKTHTLLIVLMICIFADSDAKLYKWTDENGKVHYSDKMPPDQIKNAHEELNEQGMTKEKVARDLTPEEKIAQAAELQRQQELAEQQRLAAIAEENQRNNILKAYSSVDQIKRLKNERVSALERNIQTAKDNLTIQEKNYRDLMSRAADKERSGEKVSDVFMSQIQQVKEQIEYLKSFIVEKTAEIENTKAKYDNDIAKFVEYTGQENT